ncbi:hypothetical protein J6O48_08335 [bacterium]|nr:hypothetical protein [bacterium]
MSVSLNVINLETDAVELNRYGKVSITNPDQFFEDWVDDWCSGRGELTGASDSSVDLEVIEDEDE